MELKYGRGELCFQPVGEYEVLLPREKAGVDPVLAIKSALQHPTRASLHDLAGDKVTILVSDITRPVPTHLLLPPLIEELRSRGIQEVLLVFGLGTHRSMSQAEERKLLGPCYHLPHIQHDANKCRPLGQTTRGTPVEILEEVASSDVVVATGNIEYHYYAGYSGGAKAILPGVSSTRSIITNHKLMRDPCSRSGRLDSPVRMDMEEAAGIVDLDLILNVVLNSRKEIVGAFCGHFRDAHRRGAALVDAMYRCRVSPAEIVVVSAGGSPKDINLFQAQKAMDNARAAVVPDGTMILAAQCQEGLGNQVFERWACQAKSPQDCIDRFGMEYEFGGHKAAFIAEQSLEHEIILVSELPRSQVEMCFLKTAPSLQEAYDLARQRHGSRARTIIMPYGGLTLATRDD